MWSNSNTLKADPFKTLFSCPFQHFYLYVSLANKTYTSWAGSLSTAFMSFLTRAFDFIMVEHCVVCSSVVLKKPRHTMHKFPKGANFKWQWVKFVPVKRANFLKPKIVLFEAVISLLLATRKAPWLKWDLKSRTTSSWCHIADSGHTRSNSSKVKKLTHKIG